MTAKEAHEALLKRNAELEAGSFKWGHRVMVRNDDGSFFDLNSAFAERFKEWWFVFSEHNGCHFFHEDEVYVHSYVIEFG